MEMKVLFQNKRTAVLDGTDNPQKLLEDYPLLVWDKSMNLEIGWGKQMTDGSYDGLVVYGPHDIHLKGKTIKDFAGNMLAQHIWVLEH